MIQIRGRLDGTLPNACVVTAFSKALLQLQRINLGLQQLILLSSKAMKVIALCEHHIAVDACRLCHSELP